MNYHYLTNLIDVIVDMRSATLYQQEITAYNEILDFIEGKM
jgi:hypothetical protein